MNEAMTMKGFYYVMKCFAQYNATGQAPTKMQFEETQYHAWLSWFQVVFRMDSLLSVQLPRQLLGRESRLATQMMTRLRARTEYLAYCLWHTLTRLRRTAQRKPYYHNSTNNFDSETTMASTWL